MISSKSLIAKNTLMLYFRMLLIMGVSLYTSRVVLNVLGVDDFGIYNVVGGFVMMFGFLNASMTSATQRFLSFELGLNKLDELKKTFQVTLNIHLAIAILIFLFAESIGMWFLKTQMNFPTERMDAAKWVFQFSLFSLLISIIQVPYTASLIAHERMNIYACISVLEAVFKLTIVFILEWGIFDKLKLYAALLFIVTFFIALIYKLYCKYFFLECRYSLIWDKNVYFKLLNYGGWNLYGSSAYIGCLQGGNILLNMFFGPSVNAARGIAFQVNAATQSFMNNFQLAINPSIVKSYAQKEQYYMYRLVCLSSKFSFLLLAALAVPILFDTKTILYLWLGIVPSSTILFCRLIIINSLIDSFSGGLITAIQATGKIKKYQIVIGTIWLINLPISYLFFKLGYPAEITFYVSLCISIIALLFRMFILHDILDINIKSFFKNVVLQALIVSVLASLLPLSIVWLLSPGFLRLIVVSFLSMFSFCFWVYNICLTKEDKNKIKNKINFIFYNWK